MRPPRGRAGRVAARERRGDGADEPAVDGQPLAARGLLDAGLELLGQAQVDARDRALLALGRCERRRLGGLGRPVPARSRTPARPRAGAGRPRRARARG